MISLFNTATVKSGLGGWVGVSNYADVLTSSRLLGVDVALGAVHPADHAAAGRCCRCCSRSSPRGSCRNRWFFRLAFFAPYVVPVVGGVPDLRVHVHPGDRPDQQAFSWVGLTAPNFLGSTSRRLVRASSLLTLWWTFGFNFILYTAAIQDISEEIYEAAAIDGAGPWQQIRSITVPLLRPTISLVLILQVLASLKVFDQIYILLAGGPNDTTRPVIEYIYDTGSPPTEAVTPRPRRWSTSSSSCSSRRLGR